MLNRHFAFMGLALIAAVALTGCMPKMTIDEMKAMMPERPAELDELDYFVGQWEHEGTAQMAMLEDSANPLSTTGESVYDWGEGRGYLVERGTYDMEHFDQMHMIGTWTYDAKSGKYRTTWIDSMGGISVGETRFDPDANEWHTTSSGYGPMGKSRGKYTIRIVDRDTMEWSYIDYMGPLNLMKAVEVHGVSRRVR